MKKFVPFILIMSFLPVLPVYAADKQYAYALDYSAVPADVFNRKITLIVNAGTAASCNVTADGYTVVNTYSAATGNCTFSLTTTAASVVVTAVNWTSGGTGAATKAVLYQDKKWAYSFTFDDNNAAVYTIAYPYFQARGLAGAVGVVTNWVGGGGYLTGTQLNTLFNAGWGMLNHSVNHSNSISCSTLAADIQAAKTTLESWFPSNYKSIYYIYPYLTMTYKSCLSTSGYALGAEGVDGTNYVDNIASMDRFNLYRHGMYATVTQAQANAWADAAASDTRNRWVITFTHNIFTGSTNPGTYDTNEATLTGHINYVYTTYGEGGTVKNMWFAPSDEVLCYLLTRQKLVITSVTPESPTHTPILTRTNTPANTATFTPTRTNTPVNTMTLTNTLTRMPTGTNTYTYTAVNTATLTHTNTSTRVHTHTATRTNTPADTMTNTPVNTATGTLPPGDTQTLTPTPTVTQTVIYTPSCPLIWNDEFDAAAIDSSKWVYETGAGGWGNSELEYYTSRTNNARIENGNLVIEARQESYGGSNYTSARLKTQGKFSHMYGRVEARIKLPYGQGVWPAFWMPGQDITTAGWPACGEIDIMEMIGGGEDRDDTTYGTAHWDSGGHASYGGRKELADPAMFHEDYHIFGIEWDATAIRWYLDGVQYHVIDITPADLQELRQDFFIILNLAVGGTWPGNPDDTTIFPQRMYVDWVRWYDCAAGSPTFTPTKTATPTATRTPTSTPELNTQTSTSTQTSTTVLTMTLTQTLTQTKIVTLTRTLTPILNTPVFTHTLTMTRSSTLTATATATANPSSVTLTLTAVATPQLTTTATYTSVASVPGEFIITDIHPYPNPFSGTAPILSISYDITCATQYTVLYIYTSSFRLVLKYTDTVDREAGKRVLQVGSAGLAKLGRGTYYAVLEARSIGGILARSYIFVIQTGG